ncbi:MAG: CvpA family protein [Mariprofundus sp.]
MNYVDYILIAIVGLSMVLSLWRGFVREVISLIGLVAAFLLASRLSGRTGEFLGQWVDNATVADIAGFALVFIIVMIVVGLIGALIRHMVDLASLSATDRTLGLFFGAARGMLLIALCFLVYTSYTKPDGKWLKGSMLVPYALNLGDMLGRMIPAEYPFSRQGAARYASPQQSNIRMRDLVSEKDRQALKSIIQNSGK